MRYEEDIYTTIAELKKEEVKNRENILSSIKELKAYIQMKIESLYAELSELLNHHPELLAYIPVKLHADLARWQRNCGINKYDPNQPRDPNGQWRSPLNRGEMNEEVRLALLNASRSDVPKNHMIIDGAVTIINAISDNEPPGDGKCAKFVKIAIKEGGGVKLKPPLPPKTLEYAKDYHPYLQDYFEEIKPKSLDKYSPQKGDIVVFQPPLGQDPPSGHIQMYNGKQWVSDFKQTRKFWPGKDYEDKTPSYAIYRPKNYKPEPAKKPKP